MADKRESTRNVASHPSPSLQATHNFTLTQNKSSLLICKNTGTNNADTNNADTNNADTNNADTNNADTNNADTNNADTNNADTRKLMSASNGSVL